MVFTMPVPIIIFEAGENNACKRDGNRACEFYYNGQKDAVDIHHPNYTGKQQPWALPNLEAGLVMAYATYTWVQVIGIRPWPDIQQLLHFHSKY